MANKNLGATKELTAYLSEKKQKLQLKQAELEEELKAGFDPDKYRELQLVTYHIEVCSRRLNGTFKDEKAQFELKVER